MAGIREKNLDPNTWIGLSFPLGRHNGGFFKQTQTVLEQTRHNIKNLLLTVPGERVGQPTFGSALHQSVFEPMADEGTWEDVISTSINEAISIWMPHVTISKLDVSFVDNIVNIELEFSLAVNPGDYSNLTLNFDSSRGELVYGNEDE
jgi:phage baseplate assembly protein W|tara:strand:+ start:359 stop:802 length:444 start_codon:yes stop_codon:yes gene_type:complete